MHVLFLTLSIVCLCGISYAQTLTIGAPAPASVQVETSNDLKTWQLLTNILVGSNSVELSIAPHKRGFFRAAALPTFRETTWEETPFYSKTIAPLTDGIAKDEFGVRMILIDGVLYNQPVSQSLVALAMFNGYYQNTNGAYLARARLHADRLIETALEDRGAWWLPYNYRVPLEFNYDHMEPPWFSGMAQGLAMNVMLRMHAATGEEKYREAADKFFTSFLLPASTNGSPWFMTMDAAGNVWFEEYAQDPHRGDYVFNGHIYALWSVYDYWRATGNYAALHLAQAGVATIKNRFEDLREPNFYAVYCVRHYRQFARAYQGIHIRLLASLYSLTGDLFFSQAADKLFSDAPEAVGGLGIFSGSHHAYRFSSLGEVLEVRTNAITDVELPVTREAVRTHPGVWLRVAGTHPLSGFYIREQPKVAYLRGLYGAVEFRPARKVRLLAGITHPFTKFSDNGTPQKVWTLYMLQTRDETFDCRAWIDSREWLRLTSGNLAGYWVPATLEVEVEPPETRL